MSSPHRMVVVDDDSKVRLLLERAFRAPEFETRAFPTGAAALAGLSAFRPDCVVSDILMPDMDGEGLLRAVRALPGLEHVPFIAVSAVRSEARIRSVLAAGADAFLVKPFPLRDLVAKVRLLLEQPEVARSALATGAIGEFASPTRPVVAVAHTMSTFAVRRGAAPAPGVPHPNPEPAAPPPAPEPRPAPVRQTPARVAVAPPTRPGPPDPGTPAVDPVPLRFELSPPDGGLGFGRYTRVESRGRSFVVLTEATAEPKFTVTTVITEREVPLRRVESALAHPLAREEDRDTVRRQIDLQHDEMLRRLDELVLDRTPRRIVWSDQSRSVDATVLAWTLSAVAQLAEAEVGTDECARQLRLTHERSLVEEDVLRAFEVTSSGRVVAAPEAGPRLPRRAVRAVARWCRRFADAVLVEGTTSVLEPVRQATRRHAVELERLGFYDRFARPADS